MATVSAAIVTTTTEVVKATNELVKLVIGDKVFYVTEETLKVDSPNKFLKEHEFKDRESVFVGYILHYLRGNYRFLDLMSPLERMMLLDEAKFYGFTKLQTLLEENNEVKNAQKVANSLIMWRFQLLRSRRHQKWLEDDTWWTGFVNTLMQFDFFRAIMRSDHQTDSFLTLCNDFVGHLAPSSGGLSEDDEDDDDDDEDDYEDEEDYESEDEEEDEEEEEKGQTVSSQPPKGPTKKMGFDTKRF